MNPREKRFGKKRQQLGFTFTELLVVIAVLGILMLVLFPALAGTQSRSQRTACLNNLRQIGIATTIFAQNNNDTFASARNGLVQVALNPISLAGAESLGLIQSNSFWGCPKSAGLPAYEGSFDQWLIGYQYFGGITNWTGLLYSGPSRSPVKLSLSQPRWVIAADRVIKSSLDWGGDAQLPTSHHDSGDSIVPQGGNQVFVDGSAQWIALEKMYFLHSWSTSRQCFFYHDPKDLPPVLQSRLSQLRATP